MKWVKRKPKKEPNIEDSIVEKVAKIRGIKNLERFLNPTKDELFDPYLMKGIKEARNKIIKAMTEKKKICVSYDADADGLTAASMLYRYLKNYTDNIYYIYNERNDGHGIQNQIDQIEEGTDLLIICDSSSNEVESCRKIKEMGIDIIILDHHAIEQENPYALIVNPQQEDCDYPNKHLSGVGVVFKAIQVIEDTLGQVDPFEYVDLVAVGLYADMMRVDILENRFLIMHGLRNMKNPGLLKILKGSKLDLNNLDCSAIGWTIAPLLNGVARMDKLKLAIDLLLEDDEYKCNQIYKQIKKVNEERKKRQDEIIKKYKEQDIDKNEKILIVLDEESSKGFNGLIAQQLVEKFQKPVIVGRLHEGTITGSFRSYNNFNLKDFLQGFRKIEAMGHPQAGGVCLKEKDLGELEKYIEEKMPVLSKKEPVVYYDLEIDSKDISKYIEDIERINLLTGNGFPKVIVKVNGIMVKNRSVIGGKRDTIKIQTFDDLELIKFKVDEDYGFDVGYFDQVNVVGELSINRWFNFKKKEIIITPQIKLDDYRLIS